MNQNHMIYLITLYCHTGYSCSRPIFTLKVNFLLMQILIIIVIMSFKLWPIIICIRIYTSVTYIHRKFHDVKNMLLKICKSDKCVNTKCLRKVLPTYQYSFHIQQFNCNIFIHSMKRKKKILLMNLYHLSMNFKCNSFK